MTTANNGTPAKVRWGIVSTAQIGRYVFIPALRATRRGELVAVAGRDAGRSAAFAGDLDIPEVFASYDALLASDLVDAVYLPLPNTMHEEWALRAAACGKHIFCEKPLATTVAGAQRMVDAARQNDVLLWEAMVFRYHPQTLRLRRLLDGGAIGDLRHVHMHLSFNLPTGDNIRWQPELGGGVLMDVGCYLITVARWAAASEPTHVSATWQLDAGARRGPPPGAAAGVSRRRGGDAVRRPRRHDLAGGPPDRQRRLAAPRAADPSLRGERLHPHHAGRDGACRLA